MKLTRRFLYVGDRKVHYLRAGDGPPAVLIHSSPANGWFLLPEIDRLSNTNTVFAFDTPGFGLSDPLPLEEMSVADLADALALTFSEIGMPPCPIFGSHTGAAIALEFGVRYPERVTGLILDGVPAFTTEECERLFGDYFRKIPANDLGGQYSMVWTRFRDQSVWFPWSERNPENLNEYDLSPPQRTHLWTSMYFEAADTYIPAYKAASFYGERAIKAASELSRPAIFTATSTDMLYPHMARLPCLKPGQEICDIGASHEVKRELIAEGFKRYNSAQKAPDDPTEISLIGEIGRQFCDGPDGIQIHFRYAGKSDSKPLLLLHDAPGSAAVLEKQIEVLAQNYFVVAPDLPGCGESDALTTGGLDLANYADVSLRLLDYLSILKMEVYGIGFGASVALELAHRAQGRVEKVIIEGLLLPSEVERTELISHYTPSIDIQADGGHWYKTWLMLRDSQIWWPWYNRSRSALRRTEGNFSSEYMHKWTVDVMRKRQSYGHVIQAALAHDGEAAFLTCPSPSEIVTGAYTPLSIYDDRLMSLNRLK